jgi:myo-inositol catabolism protein IolH
MLKYAGDDLSHVLFADTMNQETELRYILNPPGVDATIHQHLAMGEGEVDFTGIFETLREMDYANRTFKVGGDAISCVSYFGYPEKMAKQAPEARERIEKELLRQ